MRDCTYCLNQRRLDHVDEEGVVTTVACFCARSRVSASSQEQNEAAMNKAVAVVDNFFNRNKAV